MSHKYVAAVLTLTGAVIGAGIFGIPYVVEHAGFWTGMLCIFLLGIVLMVMNLMVGEIALRTKVLHQLTGYAEKYLGRRGKYWMLGAFSISCYTALVAYTIGVSQTLFEVFGVSQLFWAFVFYLVMAVIIFGNLRVLTGSEYYMEFVKFVVFAVLLYLMFSSSSFSADRLGGFSWVRILLPVGVVLFAFSGMGVVPLLRNILGRSIGFMHDVIVWGSVIPIVVYVLFAAGVVGITGAFTTEVATVGLAGAFAPPSSWLIHAFAFLAMTTSFIAYGYVLKWMYIEDFGFRAPEAWALTMGVPPILMFLGFSSFFRTLDIGGSFATGITAILILVIHARAKRLGDRKPEFSVKVNSVVYAVFASLFVLAMLHSLVAFL